MKNQLILGLDIGTTTISAAVVDSHDGSLLARRTVKSDADIASPNPWEKMQDATLIERKAKALLDELLSEYVDVKTIGITGQMHGIVYLDGSGKLLSPLYTWQDRRAEPYCGEIQEKTGHSVSAGYGLATHYALRKTGKVPEGATKICTIMDYLVFSLCGNLGIHSTNAASLGFFSPDAGRFDEAALEKTGIQRDILPEVTSDCKAMGLYRGIPVAVAIGDNQASFLGSVAEPNAMALANFGTGSQISVLTKEISYLSADGSLELRPFVEGTHLVCGSALCGGRAYALLEGFFRSFVGGGQEQYDALNALAEKGLQMEDLPRFIPTFCGTRSDPTVRGSICNLGEENFTPAALTAALLLGMAEELRELFARMPGERVTVLASSGNAVRKNPALVKSLERVFGMRVKIPVHQEEAAFGAALFGAAAAGNGEIGELQKRCIHYIA